MSGWEDVPNSDGWEDVPGPTRLYSPNPDAPTSYGAPDTNGPVVTPAAMAPGQPPRLPQPNPPTTPWSDVGKGFVSNFLPSVGNFVGNTYDAITHPGRTMLSIGSLLGDSLKTQVGDKAASDRIVNSVGPALSNRYGSLENLKNTIKTDPFGFLMDASIPVTGAETLGLRAPGIVGDTLRLVDPVNAVTKGAELAGKGVGLGVSTALGATTGAGARDIQAAARAGLTGNGALAPNMRGAVPIDNVVNQARSALSAVRKERGDAYRSGMLDIGNDKSILDFDAIDNAVDNASKVGTYKGQAIEPAATDIVGKMEKQIADWKTLDPAEFHTPEGIDALKRSLSNIRDSTLPNTPERVAADRIYGAVRDQISAQSPRYADIMDAYGKASGDLRDLSKTFSLGENASTETALRKLQSTSRNNVQTNYGKRTQMLDALAQHEPDLPYALAGQNLNTITPRGLMGPLVTHGAALLAGGLGLHEGLNLHTLASLAALAPASLLFSPRIVGEGAYLGGRAAGLTRKGLNAVGVTGPRAASAARLGFRVGQPENDQVPGFGVR